MADTGRSVQSFQSTSAGRIQLGHTVEIVTTLTVGRDTMRTWSAAVFGVIFATAVALLSAAQITAPSLSVDGGQIYTSASVPIQVVGTGLSPSFRIVLDGTELPTTFVSFAMLSAPWLSGSVNGEYDVMVWDTYNRAIRSNHISLILGHGRRTMICAGGLLSQSASVQTILDYEAHYDTLNCRYLQPPRCYTGAAVTVRCTP